MPKQIRQDIPIGTKFSNLEVIDNVYKNGVGFLKVKCTCGNIEEKRKWPLKKGIVTRCTKCANKASGYNRLTGYKDISGTLFGKIKRNAKIRNLELKITPEFIYNLFIRQNGKCALSGLDISISKVDKRHACSASLDRIDSSKGYLEDNVQWVHQDVNFMKQDFDQERFINLCKFISYKCG